MNAKERLIERIDKGEKFEYLLFWDEPKQASVDISCLNQWYASDFFEYQDFGTTGYDRHFRTAEHYMMYRKAELFYDWDIAKQILETKSPREVQKLGRRVKNYDDMKWQAISYNVVVEGNIEKFTKNQQLKEYLLSTEDKVLVEASPIDKIWGIGLDKNDPRATNPKEWLGDNKLGFALMEVRDYLKEISSKT